VTQFNDIFGQDAAIDTIRKACAAGRLPHGLLFTGPAGVGKATAARALAGLFLCGKPKGEAACGKCESCVVIRAGNHPDYHIISKELIRYHDQTGKSKGIDLSIKVIIPELIEPAARKPLMGRGKVFVVEQADLMSASAQNALLKTLEEPYGPTLIVLLTDQPGALLPTILSRCQVIRFAALPEDRVRRELESRGTDRDLAADAARLAGGSLGMALRWIEDGVVAAAGELTGRLDALSAGRGADDLPAWLKKAAEAYADKQLERDKLASKDQATREGLTLYLRLAAEHVRRKMPETDDPDALERACTTIERIRRAEGYIDENVNVAIALQQLSASLDACGAGASPALL
jgi:DNA polymerase III subunit delta'